MTREDIIRKIMDEKNLKVADLAKSADLPYSTVKFMLENGIDKSSYSNVNKICKAIGIKTNELEAMAREQDITDSVGTIAAHFDGDEYTEAELDEIMKFAEFVKAKRKE